MRLAGRMAAAIAVLEDFERRRVPLKIALADWARGARYAGASDRAWISGLCLDALRRRRSLAAAMGESSPRAAILGALAHLWRMPLDEISESAGEAPHGPGALTPAERAALAATPHRPDALAEAADFPDWLEPHVRRAFGVEAEAEMRAFGERADIDLRVNTLKTTPEKAADALRSLAASAGPILATHLRMQAPAPHEKTADVTVIPAFNKGWVEVQDLGSQIAAAAAGDIAGAQVLDFCAGGGGKTLALAALMGNRGQIYAYDSDASRLKPLYERSRRAGARNLQILNPLTDGPALDGLKGRMDLVFIDAPCTGSGVWRRRPDAKWRLTPDQLAARIAEQDDILSQAADFVRPDGRLVYVTCSILMEENEDRLAAFLADARDFTQVDALEPLLRSGLALPSGMAVLEGCRTQAGALRLTPRRPGSDGFFVGVLERARGPLGRPVGAGPATPLKAPNDL